MVNNNQVKFTQFIRSGRWRSVYRVTFTDDKKAKLSGSMKVNVHYYEGGNVQLNTSKEHGETVSSSVS